MICSPEGRNMMDLRLESCGITAKSPLEIETTLQSLQESRHDGEQYELAMLTACVNSHHPDESDIHLVRE